MSYENIKIEKGLYTTGKSFTQALEALDPSENYKGTSLEGLDAFERQLKRFDIKVSGKDCDTVSKFFQKQIIIKLADKAFIIKSLIKFAAAITVNCYFQTLVIFKRIFYHFRNFIISLPACK